MKKINIAILGCGGMLGSMLLKFFTNQKKYHILATVRDSKELSNFRKQYPQVNFNVLDVEFASSDKLHKALNGAKWIINAIGIIKPFIHDDNPQEIERALRINALFPHYLAQAAIDTKAQVIQIATDCVFDGRRGRYRESDIHNADDVYGKTKSLGEAYYPNIHHLRCSIIGPEPFSHVSLMDWFLRQPKNAKVDGYKNHLWNGVTTYHFARLCQGIIKKNLKLRHIQHVIPADTIAKSDLLISFAKEFKRLDTTIKPINVPNHIDRILTTENKIMNIRLWRAAGYKKPPTIRMMIKELAQFMEPQRPNGRGT